MSERDDGPSGSGDIDVLLHTEQTFPPPPEFAAQANASDPGIYERANEDPEAWWASWAEKLDWIEPLDEVLDWSDPPFAKWFAGGKLNVSANCLDRHVAAGAGDRVAYHWEGEDGTKREITYAWLLDETAEDRQRHASRSGSARATSSASSCRWFPRPPWRCSPARGSARSTTSSSAASRANSVAERMEVSGAKALITADATLRRGQPTPMKSAVDEVLGELPEMEHVIVVDRGGTEPADDARAATTSGTTSSPTPTPSASPSRWTPRTRSSSSTPRARRRSRRASSTRPPAT